jgi:hypothetical protein
MSPRAFRTGDSGIPAVWRLIDVLREAHKADRSHWRTFSTAAENLPEVPVNEAGPCAHVIARNARSVLKALVHTAPCADGAARMSLLSLSDWLNQEANAHGCEYPQPYHLKD